MIKYRCVRCRKPLGEDNKCHNPNCVLCVKEEPVVEEEVVTEETETPVEE